MRERKKALPKPNTSWRPARPRVLELDEMRTFVGCKRRKSGFGWPSSDIPDVLWPGYWVRAERLRHVDSGRPYLPVIAGALGILPMSGRRTEGSSLRRPTVPAQRAAGRPIVWKPSIVRCASAVRYWCAKRVPLAAPWLCTASASNSSLMNIIDDSP